MRTATPSLRSSRRGRMNARQQDHGSKHWVPRRPHARNGADAAGPLGGLAHQSSRFVAVRAARPATRTPFPFAEVLAAPGDPLAPGFRLLCGFDPADPFVAGERRDIRPGGKGRWMKLQRLGEVRRKVMDDPARDACFVSQASHFSLRRGISSTKLHGRLRLSSCSARILSHPSFTAPFEPGRAKM